MRSCPSCGGNIGRDCFNPIECAQITDSMNNQYEVQPYLDALNECRETISWMIDHMSVDNEQYQSDSYNRTANTLDLIDRLSPRPRTPEQIKSDLDDLPF